MFTRQAKAKPARKIIILGHHHVNEIIKQEFQYTACVPIETWLAKAASSKDKRAFLRPSFSFNCRLLAIISLHKLVVSLNFLSVRIVLSCFYLLVFYREILNLNKTFAVCRKSEAKTLNQSRPQPFKENVKTIFQSRPQPTKIPT